MSKARDLASLASDTADIASQGVLAESAVQPNDDVTLNNVTITSNISGVYSNLHATVTVVTTDINFNNPINTLTLSGNTTFTTSNRVIGKSCLFMMETSSNTPTFGSEVKWPDDTEPAWGDYPLWLITFICQTGSRVFATAVGYNT